jgi:hypothetical protein
LKRIILAAVGVAVAGLTACSNSAPAAAPAAPSTPTAASASHGSVRVPVSCGQQYNTWERGQGKGLIAALDAVSSAAIAGDTRVLMATLNTSRPAIATAARHPVPACADPRGYWDVLLMHVTAAADSKSSASSVQAAMKGVPEIEHQLTAELNQVKHTAQ